MWEQFQKEKKKLYFSERITLFFKKYKKFLYYYTRATSKRKESFTFCKKYFCKENFKKIFLYIFCKDNFKVRKSSSKSKKLSIFFVKTISKEQETILFKKKKIFYIFPTEKLFFQKEKIFYTYPK